MLRIDTQCSVEFAGTIFPSDRCCQLNDFVCQIMFLDLLKNLGGHFLIGKRHAIGVLQCGFFSFGKMGTRSIVRDVDDLFDTYTQFATHGSINILSEETSI